MRDELQRRVVNRLHKHNKHLAIWQARRMIQRWARDGLPHGSIFECGGEEDARGVNGRRVGSIGLDVTGESLGFFTSEGVDVNW